MKILHLPAEISGQIILTTKALQKIGLEARALTTSHKFNYDTDLIIPNDNNKIIRQIKKFIVFIQVLKKYDVFHHHIGSLLYKNIDVLILKLFKKKIFIEFWGSDIRLYDIEKKRNKFFISDNIINQEEKIKRLEFWSSITDSVIVSDHSLNVFLKPYFKNIYVVGQRIEIEQFTPKYPDTNNKVPLIVHAPSSKSTKGTEFVNKAIEKLKDNDNLSFQYHEVYNMSHEEAMEVYSKADIVIDQLLIGSYGIFACECMALGKPVICYILDENIASYGDEFPIINANPETIYEVLKDLILSPIKRNTIGKKSRLYAEKVHDSKVVAKKLKTIYENHSR